MAERSVAIAALNLAIVSTAAPLRSLPQLVAPIQELMEMVVETKTRATAALRREKKSFQLEPGYLEQRGVEEGAVSGWRGWVAGGVGAGPAGEVGRGPGRPAPQAVPGRKAPGARQRGSQHWRTCAPR